MKNSFYNFTIYPLQNSNTILHSCSGSNEKHIFIAVRVFENEQSELLFLQKILSATKLDLQKDILLYKHTPNTVWKFIDLAKKVNIDYLLSFGVSPQKMGLMHQCLPYSVHKISGTTCLFAHDLHQIEGDKKLKGQLWNALKEIFIQ